MTKYRIQAFAKKNKGFLQDRLANDAWYYNERSFPDVELWRRDYPRIIAQYYDLVTDSYEKNWGRNFHQACRTQGQSLQTSLAAQQVYLADHLQPSKGARGLDVGCGVGGPMSNLARLTGAFITGVNVNAYQVKKGQKYIWEAGLDRQCELTVADFLHMPFSSGSFDFAYAFEATCQAPILLEVYSEVFRVLKGNGLFAMYEWCMTDKYDPNHPEHHHIKQVIEASNAIPSLLPQREVDNGLKAAGFEICTTHDRALDGNPFLPWYSFLRGETRDKHSGRPSFGARAAHTMERFVELFRPRPQGASTISSLLARAGQALIEGGRLGIFTPMYFVLARKPV